MARVRTAPVGDAQELGGAPARRGGEATGASCGVERVEVLG